MQVLKAARRAAAFDEASREGNQIIFHNAGGAAWPLS